jgi:VIT1/CCC1 family predicted Fe2+/Mn2+ transporter
MAARPDAPLIGRYLDPAESLGEILFGLIMVLTFTVGARLLTAREALNAHEIVVAAVGCNIAWGIIDAVLFVLGNIFHRSRRARLVRAVQSAGSEAEGLALIRREFDPDDTAVAVRPEDSARFFHSVLAVAAHAGPARARLLRGDIEAALVVFLLVSATALPGVIPFLVIADPDIALRVSNLVLILLLFVVGYVWAHRTDASPWRVGLVVALLGVLMVGVAVALGG